MKIFVNVIVKFSNGEMVPQIIELKDNKYEIDKIIDCKKAASLKSGGAGLRYTVKIKNQMRYLFFEDGKWFIE